jgi:hypothetical protein
MKRKNFITTAITTFVLIGACKNVPYERYPYEIQNNSDTFIKVYIALSTNGGTYPDTSFFFPKDKLTIEVKPFDKYRSSVGASWDEIYSYFPLDTMSIFIFCKDTFAYFSWEVIQRDYKILQRYDLSLEDFNHLENEFHIPVITYPPDEQMKNMKMYPPYGTYNE